MTKPFLIAQWVNLILMSWQVEPARLFPYLPGGTTLDLFDNTAYLTMIAFEFRQTSIRGIRVPGHVNFPELNLRFYARARGNRGVVFIREFVPRPLIAWVARTVYHEPYDYCRLRHDVESTPETVRVTHTVKHHGYTYAIQVEGHNQPYLPPPTSLEHHLKEHGRGYGTSRVGTTVTYGVAHRFWLVYPLSRFHYTIDMAKLYGQEWAFLNDQAPANVTLAQGSDVQVFPPTTLP